MGIWRQVAGFFVHVQAQKGGKIICIDELAVVPGIIASSLVPQGDIQVSIRAEMEVAAIVVIRFVALHNKTNFGGRVSLVRICARNLEAGQNIVAPTPGAVVALPVYQT